METRILRFCFGFLFGNCAASCLDDCDDDDDEDDSNVRFRGLLNVIGLKDESIDGMVDMLLRTLNRLLVSSSNE